MCTYKSAWTVVRKSGFSAVHLFKIMHVLSLWYESGYSKQNATPSWHIFRMQTCHRQPQKDGLQGHNKLLKHRTIFEHLADTVSDRWATFSLVSRSFCRPNFSPDSEHLFHVLMCIFQYIRCAVVPFEERLVSFMYPLYSGRFLQNVLPQISAVELHFQPETSKQKCNFSFQLISVKTFFCPGNLYNALGLPVKD